MPRETVVASLVQTCMTSTWIMLQLEIKKCGWGCLLFHNQRPTDLKRERQGESENSVFEHHPLASEKQTLHLAKISIKQHLSVLPTSPSKFYCHFFCLGVKMPLAVHGKALSMWSIRSRHFWGRPTYTNHYDKDQLLMIACNNAPQCGLCPVRFTHTPDLRFREKRSSDVRVALAAINLTQRTKLRQTLWHLAKTGRN